MFTQNNATQLFSPRVGLAWDPLGNQKTAIRAGFGTYYSLIDALTFLLNSLPPYNGSASFTGSLTRRCCRSLRMCRCLPPAAPVFPRRARSTRRKACSRTRRLPRWRSGMFRWSSSSAATCLFAWPTSARTDIMDFSVSIPIPSRRRFARARAAVSRAAIRTTVTRYACLKARVHPRWNSPAESLPLRRLLLVYGRQQQL